MIPADEIEEIKKRLNKIEDALHGIRDWQKMPAIRSDNLHDRIVELEKQIAELQDMRQE